MEQHPYLDAKRFPLTTQGDLDLKQQKMIDAINRDDLRRLLEEGKPLEQWQKDRLAEYEAKAKLKNPP